MILVDSYLYKIDQRLNKLSSNEHQQIQLEDKIIAIREAEIKLIKQKIDVNNVHKLGLDAFKKRYQDLQFLVENFEDHKLDLTLTDKYLNKYISFITDAKVKPKFMFYLDSYVIADKGDCKDRVLYTNADLVKHTDIPTLLKNSNFVPSFEWQETIVDISADEIHIYTDGTFTPKNLYISYLRYPGLVDKEGYINFDGTPSVNRDSELEDYLEDEVLDLVVENLAMYTENAPAAQSAKERASTDE